MQVWYENNKNQNEEDFFLPLKLKNNIPSHHEKKNAKLHIYIYKTFAIDHSSFKSILNLFGLVNFRSNKYIWNVTFYYIVLNCINNL